MQNRIITTCITALLLSIISLSGCARLEFPGVYKIDIDQGNHINDESLALLESGMTPQQVRYILGTPLVVDPFNQNQWEYIHRVKKGTGEIEQTILSVYFTDGSYSHHTQKTLEQAADTNTDNSVAETN